VEAEAAPQEAAAPVEGNSEPRSGEFAVTGSATPEPVEEPVKEPSAS